MCGRVVQSKDPTTYGRLLQPSGGGGLPNAPPHFNGAPGQDYLVGRFNPLTSERTVDVLRWGLIPSWAKDRKIAWKFINARSETVRTTAAFKAAYKKRRCLLPADGFFEWKKVGKEKRPYLIGMADGEPFTLAALWENVWSAPGLQLG
jgi:putative SOS response-associated peptidase YedK